MATTSSAPSSATASPVARDRPDPVAESGRRGRWLYPLAVGLLVVNVLVVVTGGAVRLTSSGLGCPTWPQCTAGAFVAHPSLGIHGAIEFGNRLLTFVLGGVAIATAVSAWRRRPVQRPVRWLAITAGLTVPAQAVIGGITVLTKLDPWIVGLHFVFSMAVIALCTVLVRRVGWGQLRRGSARRAVRVGAWAVAVVTAAVLTVGTVVTGSGPHAGDAGSARNGLAPAAVSQLHADLVFLLLGLSIGLLVAGRAIGSHALARAAALLLGIELAQGVVGFVQYFTGLPVGLVDLHLLGAAVLAAAGTNLVLEARRVAEPRT